MTFTAGRLCVEIMETQDESSWIPASLYGGEFLPWSFAWLHHLCVNDKQPFVFYLSVAYSVLTNHWCCCIKKPKYTALAWCLVVCAKDTDTGGWGMAICTIHGNTLVKWHTCIKKAKKEVYCKHILAVDFIQQSLTRNKWLVCEQQKRK